MKANEIKIGQKIYYRGDAANREDFGIITKVIKDKYGEHFTAKLDDGRIKSRIPCLMLSDVDTENGFTRFCTFEAYEIKRKARFQRFLKMGK